MAKATQIIKTTFKVKRGSADRWKELNPILAAGEPGCELDTNQLKIGDGKTAWINLPYVGTYNGPTQDTDLSEYVTKNDMAAYLAPYLKNNQIASGTILGLVKSSEEENKIKVLADGTMEVHSLNISKLVQNEGDMLILSGSDN